MRDASEVVATVRDYSLTGPSAQRAVDAGLAEADWYRPAIDPELLRTLMQRTNARAAFDTTLWVVLLVSAGAVAYATLGTWWAVPAFAVYGALYGGSADARWHECGHATAFRTRWVNDVVYVVASFMVLREPTVWRWSHVRHHSDTIVVGRDPEIAFMRPVRPGLLALNLLNLVNGPKALARMIRHATGRIDADVQGYVPAGDLRRVVWEARAFVTVWLAVIVWSVAARSIVPLLFIGLPSFYGVWLMVFFGITQHAGLREDVLDHRLNTRTVHMNPVLRFLYLNMNYHVEHHIFPSVPYRSLPALHEAVKDQLVPASPSVAAAYREVVDALRHQRRDPTWEIPGRTPPAPVPGAVVPSSVRTIDDGIDLGPLDELPPGAIRRVDAGDRTFALCRLDDGDVALVDGVCTHGRAHLADGVLVDGAIECPKHNGRFDVRTGAPLCRPVRVALRTYDVRVVDGRLLADPAITAGSITDGSIADGSIAEGAMSSE